jgi:hypothetical protein
MDGALERAGAEIAGFTARAVYGLSDVELAEDAAGLYRVVSAATAAIAALVGEAHARDLPRRQAATSTVAWLRDLLRISPTEARTLVALGAVLDQRPALADAVADGGVNSGQAVVIGRVLADVPAEEPGLVDKVEAVLIGHATQFEPMVLRRLGDRVIAHINPELADQRLRDRLDREERHALQRRGFSMSPDGLGGMRLSGILDVHGAAIIGAAIAPLSAPARDDGGPDLRTAQMRRADALVDVCRLALRTGDLPADGGQPAQVTVTIDWQALSREVAVGQLDTGTLLSPSATRRIACDARILPAVLNGAGVPIDIGRARRPFTGAARTAVLLRDGGCAFPGCDRPPRWTEIHHIVFWAHGGLTNRNNGVALCARHHHLIHQPDSGWTIQLGPDRRPDFIPPAHIDPERKPRRNPYHQRS